MEDLQGPLWVPRFLILAKKPQRRQCCLVAESRASRAGLLALRL